MSEREDKLIQYGQMYKLISNALGIATWEMTIVAGDAFNPKNPLNYSQEFRQMLGFTDQEDFPNVLSSWSGRIHRDDYERVMRAIEAHLDDYTGKTPFDIEYRIEDKNREYRYVRDFGATLRDGAGRPLRLAGALMDMHEKKLQQEELLKAEERARLMLDTAPVSTNFWSRDLVNIDCNEEAVRFFELSGKEEYLTKFKELSPEFQPCGRPSGEMAPEMIQKAFDDGRHRFEWLHRKLNGEQLPCEITLIRVKFHDDYIVAGYTRDLREQKKLLSRLNSESERFRAAAHWYESILDAIPLLLSVQDAGTNWTFVNKATEKMLGRTREDLVGLPCSVWGRSICNTEDCAIACAKRGQMRTYFKQGEQSFQADTEIIKDLRGETAGFVEVLQDITNIEQLARQRAEAEAASLAKTSFLATMSHEIRTPMNAILGITEIQLQDRALTPMLQEGLLKIHDAGYTLLHIINDMLDLSKIDAGKMELAPGRYDVPSMINDTVHLNIVRLGSKPIDFRLEVDGDIPSELCGDELRLKQILNNLLSNAFKYTEKGTVSLSVAAETPPDGKTSTLIFEVRDTGRGMTEEQIGRIYDEYTRFDSDAERAVEGTGLGMTIVQRLVGLMGGEITVKSRPGEGSVFTVRVPQEGFCSPKIGKTVANNLKEFSFYGDSRLKASEVIREFMPYGTVLVVDDVDVNLYVAKGFLLPYGLSVETAQSGFESIGLIKAGKVYDIIFMDHMMPGMDGMEAAAKIRETGYDRPIIALTANALVGQDEMFLKNGFDDFISKPVDIRQLNVALNKFIRDRQPPEVIEAARKRKAAELVLSEERTPEDIKQLAELFVGDALKTVALMETIHKNEYRRVDDIHTYIIAVHSMKSALANIGESEMSRFALKLENAGRMRDTALIAEETPAFLSALKMLIERRMPKEEAAAAEDEDPASLREGLHAVAEACEAYDRKMAKDTLLALRSKTWSKKTKERLGIIYENLLHGNFEEAAAIAGEGVEG